MNLKVDVLKKINTICKLLCRLMKTKREKMRINSIRKKKKRLAITTHSPNTKIKIW